MLRRLAAKLAAALVFSFGLILLVGRFGRSWEARVAVRGHSMEPTLLDGDWLLVDPDAFVRNSPRLGELVVARDPRAAGRVIVKRVASVDSDDRLTLAGDHPAHGADGSAIGPVPAEGLLGRPWFRYWPLARFGRV